MPDRGETMEHYYTNNPKSEENIQSFECIAAGEGFTFYTNTGVFSKRYVDFGSMLLVHTVMSENSKTTGKLLDMGCGYGPIGIILARLLPGMNVTMADINERAVQMTEKNIRANNIGNAGVIQSDGYEKVSGSYDLIVTNPPIRAGKKVIYRMFDEAYTHLKDRGEFYSVIQKKQGADSAYDKLGSIFGNCRVINKKSGYNILYCCKNTCNINQGTVKYL
jgi:16S rRNA (guanine1207-N2)-methyltransferase